jgi:hypothetical protein
MLRYIPTSPPKILPSYRLLADSNVFASGKDPLNECLYRKHWAIDVTSSDGEHIDTFITVRALSAMGAEVMCGRASIVWEVLKLAELANPNRVSMLNASIFFCPNYPIRCTFSNGHGGHSTHLLHRQALHLKASSTSALQTRRIDYARMKISRFTDRSIRPWNLLGKD